MLADEGVLPPQDVERRQIFILCTATAPKPGATNAELESQVHHPRDGGWEDGPWHYG